MFDRSRQARSVLTLLLLLAASAPQPARAQAALPATYRCAVLGDQAACPAAPAPQPVRLEEELQPGPIALHLMHLGTDRDAALDAAAAVGEIATRRLLRITRVELSADELHRRSIGAPVRAGESVEALASTLHSSVR